MKDIGSNLSRFLLTLVGVGFLITAAIGMVGLYRGIISDALLIIDNIGADLWVVQGGHAGPFAESSAISPTMDRRVDGVAGVAGARRFVQSSQQFEFEGRDVRASVTGLDFPEDVGGWLRVVRGRHLASAHFEAIADVSLGLALGDEIRLGRDDYAIVGITRGMVDAQGDGLLFVTVNDAMTIASRRNSEEILLARNGMAETADAASASNAGRIAAVVVGLDPAADPERVRAVIGRWGDVDVLSRDDQHALLLDQRLWRLRIQILAFTGVLLVVMAIVISLIIYTMTLEKLHQIAMLKLIGARNSVIVSMIVQQAAMIGLGGFAVGLGFAEAIFPLFPRKVAILPGDLFSLVLAVVVISGVASSFGIARAMKVRAQEVLA
nr:ABC transporter permease [Jiella sonneratiae]